MNNIKALLVLFLSSLFSLNKFKYTTDKREKRRARLMIAVFLILAVVVESYISGLVFGLAYIGAADIIPTYLVFLTSALVLFIGFFRAGNEVFSSYGYDILSSMPLSSREICVSRLISLYIEDLVLSAAFMLPGIVTFSVLCLPSPLFYLIAAAGILLIPAIPLCASLLIGTLIMALSSRIKNKSLVQSALCVAFVIAVLVFPFNLQGLEELEPDRLGELFSGLGVALGRIYPPAMWLGNAMLVNDIWGLFVFSLCSLSILLLCAALTSSLFDRIMRSLSSISASKAAKTQKTERRALLSALYIREARRYFSSSIYVTNTIIGPVLGFIMSVALSVTGLDILTSQIPFELPIRALTPFALSALFCTMTTTSCSISMEGRRVWIIKSLPIEQKAIFDAKILLNLSLMLPFFIASEVALIIALAPNLYDLVWLISIPICVILFSTVFGITVDIKFHRFDWEKEEQVVKQGASAALGGFSGTLISLVGIGIVFLVPSDFLSLAIFAFCTVLALATFVLYRKNNRAQGVF